MTAESKCLFSLCTWQHILKRTEWMRCKDMSNLFQVSDNSADLYSLYSFFTVFPCLFHIFFALKMLPPNVAGHRNKNSRGVSLRRRFMASQGIQIYQGPCLGRIHQSPNLCVFRKKLGVQELVWSNDHPSS